MCYRKSGRICVTLILTGMRGTSFNGVYKQQKLQRKLYSKHKPLQTIVTQRRGKSLTCVTFALLSLQCNIYDEISEIAHLNWFPKFKKIFWRAHLPHTTFLIRIDPQNNVQLVNTQKKNSYFCKTQFFIFCSFFSFF